MRKVTWMIVACVLLSACAKDVPSEAPQSYSVMVVSTDSVSLEETFSASIEGQQDVQIYPQVTGTIAKVFIREGERVRRGQLLFLIDPVPYQAAHRTAQANVQAAAAQVESAQLEYESKQLLFTEKIISEYELSLSKNALSVAKAVLEQAEAEEANARNELSYTEVRSPTNGVVGVLPYCVGALVNSSIAQPLTTISDNEQMYVYFSMNENRLRALMRRYGSMKETLSQMPPVQLRLNDGILYEQNGKIEAVSGVINPQTGTASVRSVFPNDEQLLFSGTVGNVILTHTEKDMILVPQHATYEIQDKIFVYKAMNGVTAATQIVVDNLHDGRNYIVRQGLLPGDTIVCEGVGQLTDGQPIVVKNVIP